jgi:hypothetical protein
MQIKKSLGMITGGLVVALALPVVALAATSNVYETTAGNWSGGWKEYNRMNGNVAVSDEYGAPSGFGRSALKITTTTDVNAAGEDSKTSVYKDSYAGAQLDDLLSLSYYTYRDGDSTATINQVPALNVAVDMNGAAAGGFTTLVFEPVYNTNQQNVAVDQWQKWNAGDETIWWSSNPIAGAPNRDTFVSLASIKAANPNAVISAIAVNQGGGNPGLIAAADGLTVNDDVYNFEAPVTITNKEDCKGNGWKESTNPVFKNQGECVSKLASQDKKKTLENPADKVVNAVRSIFN